MPLFFFLTFSQFLCIYVMFVQTDCINLDYVERRLTEATESHAAKCDVQPQYSVLQIVDDVKNMVLLCDVSILLAIS